MGIDLASMPVSQRIPGVYRRSIFRAVPFTGLWMYRRPQAPKSFFQNCMNCQELWGYYPFLPLEKPKDMAVPGGEGANFLKNSRFCV